MRYEPSVRTPTASCGDRISTPKRCACATARRARSLPLRPDGKSQIVLDARTHARLPARRFALDHHRVQTFRRAIDGSRQTRRVRRRRSPDRKSRFARGFAGQLFARHPRARFPEAWCRREKAQPGGWRPPGPKPPEDAWFPDRWRKLQHRSTDRERDCAPGNRATRKIAATTACPEPGCPEMPGGRKLASHRADRSVADTDVLSAGPTASGKNS